VAQGVVGLPTFGTDVALHGNLALVATEANKILLVSLVDPTHPVLAGEIDAPAGGVLGDRLAVTDDGLIATDSFNSIFGGLHTATLGVFASLVASPQILLADSNFTTADDVKFDYQLGGDLSQVSSAALEIVDENGTLVTTIPLPIKATGEVVLSAGQPVEPTPDTMTVQVINSDGTASLPFDVQPEIVGGPAPTPVISSISPARIVTGSSDTTIAITGRNFLPSTLAVVSQVVDFSTTDTISLQYVSPTQLNLVLTADHFTQPTSWNLFLFNSFNHSNVVIVKAVPPGLPAAPTLVSVDPAQLPSSGNPQDTVITLTGTNFIPGDTIVSTTFTDQPLSYTVVSPTQINVQIPAAWQTFPLDTQFSVSSSQDSDLQSAALDFGVQNTLGVSPDPQLPEILAVNDGYVALTNSATDKPVKVKVVTVKTDAQPKIKITVNGQDVPLPPPQLLPDGQEVQLPPNVWRNLAWQARIRVQLTGTINPAKGALLGTVNLPTERVKFEKATDDNFHGFHSRHFSQKHSEEYFLSVPTGSTNNVIAVLPDKHYLKNGVTVTYDGGPFLLNVPPPPAPAPQPLPAQTVAATTQKQTLTVNGLPANGILSSTTLFPLNANRSQNVNGQVNNSKVGVLGLQSMPPRQFNLVVHFVGIGDPATADPPTAVPDRAKDNIDWLRAELNAIWQPQANVSFTVQLPAHDPQHPNQFVVEKVPYDAGTPGKLAVAGQAVIINAIPIAQPNDINIYFVHSFDDARVAGGVLGQAQGIGVHALFISDVGGVGHKLTQITAHEIGHTIGLTHNASSNANHTDCTVTGGNFSNHFIDFANGDSDGKDTSSLMWCFADERSKHIGTPFWFLLNEQNPIQ
jgi:hypothetical protein